MAVYTGSTSDLTDHGRVYVNGGQLGVYATFFQNEQAAAATPTMSKDSSKEAPAPAPNIAKGFYADIAATGGYNSYDTRPQRLAGRSPRRHRWRRAQCSFRMGYDFKAGGLTFGPTASLQLHLCRDQRFQRTRLAGSAKISTAARAKAYVRPLASRPATDWKCGSVLIKPEIRASWQHEYGDTAYALDSSFANGGGGTFTVNGPKLGRDSALLGAGLPSSSTNASRLTSTNDGELAGRIISRRA